MSNIDFVEFNNLVAQDDCEQSSDRGLLSSAEIDSIVKKFNLLYQDKKQYISLNDFTCPIAFAEREVSIIRNNPTIFYLCTPKRALLLKWVVDELEIIFQKKECTALNFADIYMHMRIAFACNSFNRENLQNLIGKSKLSYKEFCCLKECCYRDFSKYKSDAGNLPTPSTSLHPSAYQAKLSDRLKYAINTTVKFEIFQLNTNLDAPDGYTLHPNENKVLEHIKNAIQFIDQDLLRQCFNNPMIAKNLLYSFSEFVDKIEQQSLLRTKIRRLIRSIAPSNNDGRISALICAYSKEESSKILLEYFAEIKYVSDLLNVNLDVTNETFYIVVNFLTWLKDDVRTSLYEKLSITFKDKRNRDIVATRALGATLEEVGMKYSLTRERVRQIEAKHRRQFDRYIEILRPQYILLAYSSYDNYFGIDEINSVYGDLSSIFYYLLKGKKISGVQWVYEIDAFLVGDTKWYSNLQGIVDSLPAQIEARDFSTAVTSIYNNNNCIGEQEICNMITSSYKLIGNTYSKRRLSKRDMLRTVVERYYPNGIKLFNDFEMAKFKRHIRDLFGDFMSADNTRTISMAITHFTILCNRGKYILPSEAQIDHELFEEIYSYILASERNALMYGEIYERFKEELTSRTNIDNRYFLQGVLKYLYRDYFDFSRDTLCKNSAEERSIKAHIESFIRDKQRVVTKEEIRTEFLGITEIVLSMAVADKENILQWGFGEYLHASVLRINEDIVTRIKLIIDAALKQEIVSSRVLFDEMFLQESEMMIDNGIENHFALFSFINYLFPYEYEYNRPYISVIGVEELTTEGVVFQYTSNFDELAISDLKTYLEDMRIRIMNFTSLLDDISDDFLRVDEDMLVRVSRLKITKDVITQVEENISVIIAEKGYLAAKDFESFFFFPYIGIKWTPFLLVAFIKKYCPSLSIFSYVVDYRYLNEIIATSKTQAKDYYQLLRYALINESNMAPFKCIGEVESFLKQEGLVANSIPQMLFDDGIIIISELGEVKIC